MSGVMSTSKWLKFFTDAGLPMNVSANYAVLFTDNRITTDMLLDLTKEYLYDMGIKVMGDVISILRYARTAYTQDAQEKIFQEKLPRHAPLKSSTPASRMLKHYSQQSPDQTKTKWQDVKRKEHVEMPIKKFARTSVEQKSIPLVRGQCDSSDIKTTTAQFQQSVQGKRSVFHRLGENSVSSSTDLAKSKVQGHSVFQRLGGSSSGTLSSQAASSTVNDDDEDDPMTPCNLYNLGPPLQYRGILKPSSATQIRKPITFTSTPIKPKPNITEWIKPSVLNRRVGMGTQQTLVKHKIIKKSPRLISSTSSDPSLLFRRSLLEAEAQRRKESVVLYKGLKELPNKFRPRLGLQEKTLTVRLPKSISFVNKGQRFGTNPLLSKTMISDKNSDMVQRKNRIALAKQASSNRIIFLNKSQARANVFSRLGS